MSVWRQWFKYLVCLCLSACGTSSALVTMNSFHDVPVGATTSEVTERLGEPYAIHRHSNGTVEYEYIERISAGIRNFEENHYFLVFKENKLVSRRVKTTTPPPYRFDSYEMQTTQSVPSN